MCNTSELEQQQKQSSISITTHREIEDRQTKTNVSATMNINADAAIGNVQQDAANIQLMGHAQQILGHANATDTAAGTPIQEQAPAQMTWKERRRENKKTKEARKHCPVGTATTYDMVTGLQERAKDKSNFAKDHPEATPDVVDLRVLRAFARGHKQGRNGQPATAEDAELKILDDQYAADYLSGNVQRRAPHLERMVNEMLALRMETSMFSERYLRQHAAEMREDGDKMYYFNNVMNDPINKPFFDHLDPARKAAIEIAFKAYVPLANAFAMHCQKYGVDCNMAQYYGYEDLSEIPIQQGRDNAQFATNMFRTELETYHRDMAANEAAQAERVRNAAGDYAARMRANNAALNKVKEDPNLGLRAGEESSQFLTRAAMLMDTEQTEEAHARNIETVKTTLEIGRVPGGTRPSVETYEKAKALCMPTVEKILSCDVDMLLSLTDEALMVRSAELNQLFMDNMFISDIMKLQHPNYSWHDRTAATLKEDMLGARQIDFTYKQNIIRGLAEKARGLALIRQKQTGEIDGTFLTSGEQAHLEDLENYANSRIKIGTTAIESATTQRNKLRTPGTPEYTAHMRTLLCKGVSQYTMPNLALVAVGNEFENDKSPEGLGIMERIRNNQYRSIALSEAEHKERGIPSDIGEAIFRVFSPFQCYEAAEKLLTPEQYRQMIKDIGAGAGMHKGIWTAHVQRKTVNEEGQEVTVIDDVATEGTSEKLLQPAIEANKRGLAVYKTVLKAQFDMLERKYGTAIEQLSIEDIMDRYSEIAKDFSDIQVSFGMATKFPDFIDAQNPEDVQLQNRIKYYSIMGNSAVGYFQGVASGIVTQTSDLIPFIQSAMEVEDCAEGRAWLQEHQAGFVRNKIDWSQKVRVPGADAPAGQ